MDYDIKHIQKLAKEEALLITGHCSDRMEERNISYYEILDCLLHGEIIEEYDDSCLMLRFLSINRVIHVVVAPYPDILVIETTYIPNDEKWESDYRTRRKAK